MLFSEIPLPEWIFLCWASASALSWLHNRSRLKSSYFVPYLTHSYKTKFLNSHGAGYRYSQDSSAINLGIACYDKPVALPNKKIIIIRRIWRFLGMKPFQQNVTS